MQTEDLFSTQYNSLVYAGDSIPDVIAIKTMKTERSG